eukprot:scaffold18420_cov56-Phaeocystis_antarctica.AAC.2
MAASCCASALSSVDLPALGGPKMATRTPSRTTSPRLPSDSCSRSASPSVRMLPRATSSASVVTSSASSPKSMSASVYARALSSCARHPSYISRCTPLIWDRACLRCSSVSALIRSESPSTCVSSILPPSKACRVNSPASANLSPRSEPSASSTAVTTARLPCVWNSTTSSPVNERGPGNHSTSDWSIVPMAWLPMASLALFGHTSDRSTARRGGGSAPVAIGASSKRAVPACGPDTRITETPARPAPEDSAKIVSADSLDGT